MLQPIPSRVNRVRLPDLGPTIGRNLPKDPATDRAPERGGEFFGFIRHQDIEMVLQIHAFNSDGRRDDRNSKSHALINLSFDPGPEAERSYRQSDPLEVANDIRLISCDDNILVGQGYDLRRRLVSDNKEFDRWQVGLDEGEDCADKKEDRIYIGGVLKTSDEKEVTAQRKRRRRPWNFDDIRKNFDRFTGVRGLEEILFDRATTQVWSASSTSSYSADA
jgi:hypothetical protein